MKIIKAVALVYILNCAMAARVYHNFDNQTAYELILSRLEYCNDILGLSYHMEATTNYDWMVYAYGTDEDDVIDDIDVLSDCLQQGDVYRLGYQIRVPGHNYTQYEDDDYQLLPLGPAYLPALPHLILDGPVGEMYGQDSYRE